MWLIKCSSSGQAYVDFLSDTAENEPLPQAIIAFAPCIVLWDWLGGRMKSCIRPGNAYNDWIKGLSGSRKSADFSNIEPMLHQALVSEPQQCVETFRNGMRREYDFFNSVIPDHAEAAVNTLEAGRKLPCLPCFLGLGFLATLTWAKVGGRKVSNPEAQQALLK
ncbi:unnamed protein product [Effrenium voratum]|nr:unnamed protein product [Effrenium voratum]